MILETKIHNFYFITYNKTIWYTDGSAAHEGVMVGRTNYDKDTGEEC
jgi:hypothetical protein